MVGARSVDHSRMGLRRSPNGSFQCVSVTSSHSYALRVVLLKPFHHSIPARIFGHLTQKVTTGDETISFVVMWWYSIVLTWSSCRRGHYIVGEHVDRVVNKYQPTFPWAVSSNVSSELNVRTIADKERQYAVRFGLDYPVRFYRLKAFVQFGNSQVVSQAQLPRVIEAVVGCLTSPETDTEPNDLVLVGHGIREDLHRLEELGVGMFLHASCPIS